MEDQEAANGEGRDEEEGEEEEELIEAALVATCLQGTRRRRRSGGGGRAGADEEVEVEVHDVDGDDAPSAATAIAAIARGLAASVDGVTAGRHAAAMWTRTVIRRAVVRIRESGKAARNAAKRFAFCSVCDGSKTVFFEFFFFLRK